MNIVVLKFGGNTLKDENLREKALYHIEKNIEEEKKVVVVVSAIGRLGDSYSTDTLLSLCGGKNSLLSDREKDMLMSCGEEISCTIFSNFLLNKGIKAVSLSGGEAGIITDKVHTDANIININKDKIIKYFEDNDVVIVAGFQGKTKEGVITTLGRGGSDITAAALGYALSSEFVDIFTDVNGILTADPKVVKTAKTIELLTYEEAFQMASLGAKVLHEKSLKYVREGNIPLRIKSLNKDENGTKITSELTKNEFNSNKVIGVASKEDLCILKISLDETGILDELKEKVRHFKSSIYNINVCDEYYYITLDSKSGEKIFKEFNNVKVEYTDKLSKISLVLKEFLNIAHSIKILNLLKEEKIPIKTLYYNYRSISFLVDENHKNKVINLCHEKFIKL